MRSTKADKVTDLVLTIFRLNGILVEWGDDFAAPEGLSSARWQMLGALALAGQPLTAPQIAMRVGVSRQGAQKQLNSLIEAGLAEAGPNPMHKRSPLYVLTGKGKFSFDVIDARWKQHAARTAELFNSSDLTSTVSILVALIDAMTPAKVKPELINPA